MIENILLQFRNLDVECVDFAPQLFQAGFEVLKRRGLIDDYKFMTRTGYVKGSPNVLIMTHVPSAALDDPNQARDQAVQKEIYSVFSKEKGEAAVSGYEKYRTFIDNGNWQTVIMAK